MDSPLTVVLGAPPWLRNEDLDLLAAGQEEVHKGLLHPYVLLQAAWQYLRQCRIRSGESCPRKSPGQKKWEANTSQPTSTDNSLLLSQTKSLLEAGYSITLLPSAHVRPRLELDSFTWDWTSSVAYSLLTAAWVEVESQPDPPTTLIPFLKSFELLWIGLVQVGLNNVDGLLGV